MAQPGEKQSVYYRGNYKPKQYIAFEWELWLGQWNKIMWIILAIHSWLSVLPSVECSEFISVISTKLFHSSLNKYYSNHKSIQNSNADWFHIWLHMKPWSTSLSCFSSLWPSLYLYIIPEWHYFLFCYHEQVGKSRRTSSQILANGGGQIPTCLSHNTRWPRETTQTK